MPSAQTSGALILITKKTGTSQEQNSGFNHEYQWNLIEFGLNRMKPNWSKLIADDLEWE